MGQGSRAWYAEATPPESARRARSYRARDPCVRSSRRRCSRSVSSAMRARSRVVAADVLTWSSSHAGGKVRAVATMADLDELALALPQTTKQVSDDGRPEYLVHGKTFCFHRGRRRDAVDETGKRLGDVLMFRV